jgi:hypothetical protein
MSRLLAIAVVVACCATAALPASATTPKDLWATINVCDTAKHDNMMGVRASMPGDGAHTRMYMRFTAQYYSRTKQLWSAVKGSGVSSWIFVGSGDFARRQGGYTFAFEPATGGDPFILRGAVDFKWTKSGHVIRTARLLTRRGHPYTNGADPQSFSAGLCELH